MHHISDNLEVNTVESELRDIDADFAAGRMSAFGTPASHDEIVKVLRKVNEPEMQVFLITTAQVSSNEHAQMLRTLRSAGNLSSGDVKGGGGSDVAVEVVAKNMKSVESTFDSIGEHLRQMSSHVVTLNSLVARTQGSSAS